MSIELSNLAGVRARDVQQDFEQQTAFGQQPRRESSLESPPSPERRLQLGALLDPHTTSTVGFQSRLENWLSAVYSDATGYAPAPRRVSMAGSVASGHTGSSQGSWDFCDRGAPVAGSPYFLNGTPTGFFMDGPTTEVAPNRPVDGPDAAVLDHASWDEISLDGSEFETINLESEDCLTMHLPRFLTVLRRSPPPPPPPPLVVAVATSIGNTVMRVGHQVVALGKWGLASWFGRAT